MEKRKNQGYEIIDSKTIEEILKKHELWLDNELSGERASFQGVNLQGADFRYADLRYADLQGANLQGANLQGANLRGANLEDINLRESDLRGAKLRDAFLGRANLQGANLQGINLQDAFLRKAELQDASLQGANLQGADLEDINFREADLRGANLRYANLEDANFQDADLQDAFLQDAFLIRANFQGANLKDADLQGAKLENENESQYMKNLTELTIVQTYEFKGNNFGDTFEKIVDIGYDEKNAQDKALDALRYACCKDFTNPVYCSKGTVAEYFKTEGVKLENGYDEEELAEFLKCDYIVILEYKGNEYALRDDFINYTDGGKFISDEVRQFDRWDDVKPHMDADKIPKSEQKESSQPYISLKSLKQLADNQKATQNDIKSQHRSDEMTL